MGISPGFVAAAREIENDPLRFLSRGELAAFGIDRRDSVEGAWWFVDQPAGGSAMKVIEARDPAAGGFCQNVLRLGRRDNKTIPVPNAPQLHGHQARPVDSLPGEGSRQEFSVPVRG